VYEYNSNSLIYPYELAKSISIILNRDYNIYVSIKESTNNPLYYELMLRSEKKINKIKLQSIRFYISGLRDGYKIKSDDIKDGV
jgi:hypothetical protein